MILKIMYMGHKFSKDDLKLNEDKVGTSRILWHPVMLTNVKHFRTDIVSVPNNVKYL